MMKKTILFTLLIIASTMMAFAQRGTDKLDRGLVAVKTTNGVYCSWRIMGEEYYDVKYNLYRDGTKVNSEPLNVSNYTDAAGTTASKYTVKAVVRGKEEATASKEATVWGQNYLEITPDHGNLTSTYVPNDACMADVDGDGELEILMKFDNASWAGTSYQKAGYNGEYFIIEVFKLNGKRLWWVDLGPNMADFQNNEQNIVAYDWDQDGKAEAVMRASDGTVIHMADGTTQVIGDASKNYLAATSSGQWFIHEGNEFLVYMNGETGKPYQVMEYPLKRLEDGETNLEKAWGDGYGHRSTKHFFGAPYLDGRKPSIFLARGIYTRHKFVALDVNPATHELEVRWRWNCNDSSSPWYGNGYHNYAIADVDWDGRDEICYGSMVIDDNGKGLSTTGYGHGDAQHHGDFNPYVHGQEIFACLEDSPSWGNNYRDGTTAKVYYKYTSGRDDGRCMAGNFSNDYPGAMAFSGYDDPISCVTADHITGLVKTGLSDNMRIYWDGDLQEECFNYSNGKNTAGHILKYKVGEIEKLTGSMTNNDTKGTPCYQGDVFGDWREEVVMRTADNKIRIYTTTIPTEWRNYTLWHDMQYRNAMVWQMCGYNQPPHVSYFLGELEGITQAPPALTMTNRTEVNNGGSIGTALNDQQVLLAETNDMTVSVTDGASPYIFFDNAPSWVQGTDVDGTSGMNPTINYAYYTHTLTGGAFSGVTRIVKQGDGTLVLPNVTEKHTGNTDVWAGTLQFDGTMETSPVWLNRHSNLISNGGKFMGGIKADYNATIYPGGKGSVGELTTTDLSLGFGSRIVFDVNSDGTADQIHADKLTIEKKDWQYGPEYNVPVFQITIIGAEKLPEGKFQVATVSEIVGSLEDIKVEGIGAQKAALVYEEGKLYLNIAGIREAANITWDGGTTGIWDFAETENFKSATGESNIFVTGDQVTFNDEASNTTVKVEGELNPGLVTFDNTEKDYTIEGSGNIVCSAPLVKKGEGNVTINNVNKFSGGVNLNAGKLTVASLANTDGTDYAALGGKSNRLTFYGGTLAISKTLVSSQPITISTNGTIEVPYGVTLTQNGTITGSKKPLEKTGAGTLVMNGTTSFGAIYIQQGTVQCGEVNSIHQYPDTIVLNGGTLKDPDDIYSYSTNNTNVRVPEGKTGTWTLDARCNYKGKLLGKGNITVNVTNTRSYMQGDWSQFEGTINFQKVKTGSYEPEIIWDNTYGLGKATVTGIFHNSGKNVSIGTLSDNVTLTGGGTYTAKNLELKITRIRGNNSNSYITAAGTLSITGTINVTLVGNAPSVGDEITLWKVGRISTTTSVVVNLPELPAGRYWDTSDLLKAEGKLRVTDKPTGIYAVKAEQQNNGKTYTLSGMPVENLSKKGIYIRNGKKIIIK